MTYHDLNHACPYALPTELDYLHSLAQTLPAGAHVVMLGAGPGVMAMAVLEGNPKLHMTIIDNKSLEYARVHLAQAGCHADYMLSDSAEAAEWWTEPIALLIVDADHSYAAVKRDLEAWFPHMELGGYIFCHDYDAEGTEFSKQETYPGVKAAVTQFVLEHPIENFHQPYNWIGCSAILQCSKLVSHE